MTVSYMAYANMIDVNGKKWRVNISHHDTEQEAKEAALKFAELYSEMPVKAQHTGVNKFYSISSEEWAREQYTSTSITDPSVRTWMINEGMGCVLLFEGIHFEIV